MAICGVCLVVESSGPVGNRVDLDEVSRSKEVDGSILSVPGLADRNLLKLDTVLGDGVSCFRDY